MMEPFARIVRDKIDFQAFHGVDNDRVFPYPLGPVEIGVDNIEEVPVEVHGVGHHAPVQVSYSYVHALFYIDRGNVRVDLPVDRPVG